jgi:hypothetical protein
VEGAVEGLLDESPVLWAGVAVEGLLAVVHVEGLPDEDARAAAARP